MIGKLRRGDIEPEQRGKSEAHQRRRSEHRIDSDDHAKCEAPGEPLRAGTQAQHPEHRQRDSTKRPAVLREISLRVVGSHSLTG